MMPVRAGSLPPFPQKKNGSQLLAFAPAVTAIRLTSVPELVKRTGSIDGKAQITAANRASVAL
jgi:hypothetical protein